MEERRPEAESEDGVQTIQLEHYLVKIAIAYLKGLKHKA